MNVIFQWMVLTPGACRELDGIVEIENASDYSPSFMLSGTYLPCGHRRTSNESDLSLNDIRLRGRDVESASPSLV